MSEHAVEVAASIDATTDIAFGRTTVPVPLGNKPLKKDMLGFEYAEHSFIGDAINLTLADGQKVPAIDHTFRLKNGLVVTYGQINGLAGDFYGTYDPISDGSNSQEQSKRFVAAYNTLADGGSRQPKEAQDILAVLQAEVDAVNDALKRHEDPSVVYSQLPDVSVKLEALTFGRSGIPAYLGLAQINWDHFGEDARTAYNAGHATALQVAAAGDLESAYALNAFADHFVEDSFSSGHLRTPRRLLHRSADITADACAKFMHDEDSAIGISVENPAGQSWVAFGDKRALDKVNVDNLKRCVAAVQASADEIYDAYSTKHVPTPDSYQAWTHAPTLASARGTQLLTTLFTFSNGRRSIIENRIIRQFKTDWWFWSTALECKTSGWWKFPITIDGPPKIVPGTDLAVTNPRTQSNRVYYQSPQHGVLESSHGDGKWSSDANRSPVFDAAPFTPLAAINWAKGDEIRVYHLNKENKVQEFCYSAVRDGGWYPGALNDMNVQAAANTSIAALYFGDRKGDVHIRVYCQESDSNAIQEFCFDGQWSRGATLPHALRGTRIGGVAYDHSGLQLRIYYQAEDLTLREHCYDGTQGWFAGAFNPGKAPGRTSISALGWADEGGVVLYVYWMDRQREIVSVRCPPNSGSATGWADPSKVVGPLMSGARFAAAQWEDGKHVRVYYQSDDNSVMELCSDHGDRWYSGATVAHGK